MLGVGVVGTGYWGKNLVRNFSMARRARLAWLCDTRVGLMEKLQPLYPQVRLEPDFDRLLEKPDLDAVVIATPAPTHFVLARRALEAGKHVFVEKPLTLDPVEARILLELSRERDRVLMVGHLLEFHPGVRWIKQHLDALGRIYYVYSQRLNLGIVRDDENAWWSLAPHDISVILYLLQDFPVSVSAQGACYLRSDIEDVVFANLHFRDGTQAQIHVSWLDPHKIRKFTLVGEQKMVTFDDMEASEKIKVFDKGAVRQSQDGGVAGHITVRSGDIYLPSLDTAEPLKLECEHFVECCLEHKTPLTDGADGLRVVQVLDAAQRSLQQGGAPVLLERLDH